MKFVNWKPLLILSFISVGFVFCELSQDGNMTVSGPKYGPFDHFTGIKAEDKPFLKNLTLIRLNFDPNILLNSLNNCTSLKVLRIQNCEWNGNFIGKIRLDNLRKFNIRRTPWSFKQSTHEEILSLLFFNTNPDPMVFNMSGVRVKITGSYLNIKNRPQDGRQPETIENSQNVLTLKFVPFDVTNSFQFRELYSTHSTINATTFKGRGVHRVRVESEKLHPTFLNAFLTRLVDVNELTIKNHALEPEIFDLSVLPNPSKLDFLQLENLIIYTANSSALFSGLTHLALQRCSLTKQTDGNLSNIDFTSLRTFTVSENPALFDLRNLKFSSESLQNLSCSKSQLTLSQNLKFPSIKFIQLFYCLVDEKAANSFSSTFHEVDSISIQGNLEDHLLSKLLETKVSQLVFVDVEANFGSKLLQILTEANVSISSFGRKVENAVLKRTNGTWKCTQLFLRSWKDYLALFYSLTLRGICVLGLVGNTFIGIVMCREPMLHSTGVIILGLALCDSVVLLAFFPSLPYFATKLLYIFLKQTKFYTTHPVASVLDYFKEQEFADTTDFFYALNKTAYSGSVFCTMLLTVERYIAVTWPVLVKRLIDRRRTTLLVTATMLLAVLLNISRWFEAKGFYLKINTLNLRDVGDGVWETLLTFERHPKSNNPISDIRYYQGWLWILLMYFIPIPLLGALNYKIWKKIRYSRQERAALPASSAARKNADVSSVTRMLFTVVAVSIACNVTNGVILFHYVIIGEQDPLDMEVIACIPLIINSAVNFIIYFVLGKKFRMEFMETFKIQRLMAAFAALFNRVPRQKDVRLRPLGRRASYRE